MQVTGLDFHILFQSVFQDTRKEQNSVPINFRIDGLRNEVNNSFIEESISECVVTQLDGKERMCVFPYLKAPTINTVNIVFLANSGFRGKVRQVKVGANSRVHKSKFLP